MIESGTVQTAAANRSLGDSFATDRSSTPDSNGLIFDLMALAPRPVARSAEASTTATNDQSATQAQESLPTVLDVPTDKRISSTLSSEADIVPISVDALVAMDSAAKRGLQSKAFVPKPETTWTISVLPGSAKPIVSATDATLSGIIPDALIKTPDLPADATVTELHNTTDGPATVAPATDAATDALQAASTGMVDKQAPKLETNPLDTTKNLVEPVSDPNALPTQSVLISAIEPTPALADTMLPTGVTAAEPVTADTKKSDKNASSDPIGEKSKKVLSDVCAVTPLDPTLGTGILLPTEFIPLTPITAPTADVAHEAVTDNQQVLADQEGNKSTWQQQQLRQAPTLLSNVIPTKRPLASDIRNSEAQPTLLNSIPADGPVPSELRNSDAQPAFLTTPPTLAGKAVPSGGKVAVEQETMLNAQREHPRAIGANEQKQHASDQQQNGSNPPPSPQSIADRFDRRIDGLTILPDHASTQTEQSSVSTLMVSTKDLPAEITVESVSINAVENTDNDKDPSATTASTPSTTASTMAVFSESDHGSGVVIDTTNFRLSSQNGSAPLVQSNSATAASTAMRADNAGFIAQRDRAMEQQIISALRNGRDEIRFSLYPATLGQVTINLALDGQKVRIGMKTSNRDASALLLGERQSLITSLGQEGFTLDGFDVTDDATRNPASKDQSQNHPSKTTSRASDDRFSLDITI